MTSAEIGALRRSNLTRIQKSSCLWASGDHCTVPDQNIERMVLRESEKSCSSMRILLVSTAVIERTIMLAARWQQTEME